MFRIVAPHFLLLSLGLLVTASSLQSGELSGPDTVWMNKMAREVRTFIWEKQNLKAADSVISQALALENEEGIPLTQGMNWAIAEFAYQKKDFGKAYKYSSLAMKPSPNQLGKKGIAELVIFHAKTCVQTGQFTEAVEVLEKNLNFAENNDIKGILSPTWLGLAEVYLTTQHPEQALKSLSEALKSAKADGDAACTEAAYYQLGRLRLDYKYDDRIVEDYIRKSLEYAVLLGDSAKIVRSLSNLAWNFYLSGELDSATSYYKQTVGMGLSLNLLSTAANAYGNLGNIYRDLNNPKNAKALYEKGLELAHESMDWYNLSWIYKDLSIMEANAGHYQQAWEYQVLHKQFSDSVQSQSTTQNLSMALTKFEIDSKQKELELLSWQLKNQRFLLFGIVGILLFSVIIGLLLLRQSRLNARRKISEMDQKILEVTQANLRQQMNPHFIFNTLNSIQYYMYKHDKLATNNYLTKFSSLMRKILENSQHTAIPIQDELDALKLYLELESIRFRDKFDYEILVDDEIDPLVFKIPTMLIQPYVENAISHGLMYREQKGKVKIDLQYKKDFISCLIEDNGIGRAASKEIRRQREGNHNSLGTRITESRLNLVNSLYGTALKIDFTDLTDEQGEAAGTRVEIHIPILT